MQKKKLPIGIEFFDEMRREDFYYIDKTGLIRDLLNNRGKANLFTRPRRFGKTLSMSMLETIEKALRLKLTYAELDTSIDNLWSVLFTTGYLTQAGRAVNGVYQLVIPNREVREVFILQIQEWFRACVAEDEKPMRAFCQAFLEGKLGRYADILSAENTTGQRRGGRHGAVPCLRKIYWKPVTSWT